MLIETGLVVLLLGLIALSLGHTTDTEDLDLQVLKAKWTGTDGVEVDIETTRGESESASAFNNRHEEMVTLQKAAHPPVT